MSLFIFNHGECRYQAHYLCISIRLLQRSSSWLGHVFVLSLLDLISSPPRGGDHFVKLPFFMLKNASQIWLRLLSLALRITFGVCRRISVGDPRIFTGVRLSFFFFFFFPLERVCLIVVSRPWILRWFLFLDLQNLPSNEGRVLFWLCRKIFSGARFGDWVAVGLSGSFGNLDLESNAILRFLFLNFDLLLFH